MFGAIWFLSGYWLARKLYRKSPSKAQRYEKLLKRIASVMAVDAQAGREWGAERFSWWNKEIVKELEKP
jgi:hypothetical protein